LPLKESLAPRDDNKCSQCCAHEGTAHHPGEAMVVRNNEGLFFTSHVRRQPKLGFNQEGVIH
jgi:hypothetical protein